MRGVLLTAAVVLLIPGLLGAATPTVGLYFNGLLHANPEAMTIFTGHLFMIQYDTSYWVTGVEYRLERPMDEAGNILLLGDITYPELAGLSIGDPFSGHAITYWPPLTFFPTGMELLVSFDLLMLQPCSTVRDFPLIIGPDPGSGHARFAYYPNNELEEFVGLTSYLCLDEIATQEGSWGAIKSLYR